VPIAGAISGGIGLLHNQGTKKNVMNGAQTGASIGTMAMPGIGTAVGAGIGALAGWARGIGTASPQELAGRDAAAGARQMITSGTSQDQISQAKNSGWKKPDDALALIVLRDKLLANGGTSEQANQLMNQLFQAEKGGSETVEHVMQQIAQATGGANGPIR
jgi:hypothetical protein